MTSKNTKQPDPLACPNCGCTLSKAGWQRSGNHWLRRYKCARVDGCGKVVYRREERPLAKAEGK
jgi:hypothetical protein